MYFKAKISLFLEEHLFIFTSLLYMFKHILILLKSRTIVCKSAKNPTTIYINSAENVPLEYYII